MQLWVGTHYWKILNFNFDPLREEISISASGPSWPLGPTFIVIGTIFYVIGTNFYGIGTNFLGIGTIFIRIGTKVSLFGTNIFWNWDQFFFSKIFYTFELLLAQIFNLPQKNLRVHNYFGVKITESLTFWIGHLHGDERFASAPPPRSRGISVPFSSWIVFMITLQCPKAFINFSGQIVHSTFSLYTEEAFVSCKHSHCSADADIQWFFMLRQEVSMIGIMDGRSIGWSVHVKTRPSCQIIFLLAGLSSYL